MEISKRCKDKDRLSELPDSVIFEIFWLLPMTDVVRTSVLSERWRNLWINTPFLNFDNVGMSFRSEAQLRKFVTRALLCWKGDRVLKFRFDSFVQLGNAMHSDIDLWLSFAIRNAVEELDLNVRRSNPLARDDFGGSSRGQVYWVPHSLYSCSSLKRLTIEDCSFEVFGNVQWNQLESLCIDSYMVSANDIDKILSGSPQLRVFELRVAERGESFTIQSSSLKELFIHKFHHFGIDIDSSTVSELKIWTPNLETLEITGIPFNECLLMDVSSVTNATLGLSGVTHDDDDDDDDDDDENSFLCGNTLSQILPTIQHVENVTLSDCCTKVLEVMIMKCMNSSFPNVKSIELGCCFNDYEQVVDLLANFPKLERLVLVDKNVDDHHDDQETLMSEANPPESFLLQLRTIEVTWIESSRTLPLIKILLNYASKLEKMVFRVKELKRLPFFMATQKVLRIPRSSPSCKIDFHDCRNESTGRHSAPFSSLE